jgi:serine/threonine protein kinase
MLNTLIGQKIGQYEIVGKIGEGGMATIYKAYQPSVSRYVAVKVLPEEFAEDPKSVERFEQEVKAIARLEHPNILPVHDSGTQDRFYYMVMRYVEGGTLADLMDEYSVLPCNQAIEITMNIAKALSYAHSKGVIHRDIKPSNILIDQHGGVSLTDFGIAKMLNQDIRLTRTGLVMGTPDYMSPEQAQDQAIDGRSDIYSLAVVLYEMITGYPPYMGETPMSVAIKHVNDPVPSPRTVNPDIPEAVEQIIFKAMAKNPTERFQTAEEFEQSLQAVLVQIGRSKNALTLSQKTESAPIATKLATVMPETNKRTREKSLELPINKNMLMGIIIGIAVVCVFGGGGLLAGWFFFRPPPPYRSSYGPPDAYSPDGNSPIPASCFETMATPNQSPPDINNAIYRFKDSQWVTGRVESIDSIYEIGVFGDEYRISAEARTRADKPFLNDLLNQQDMEKLKAELQPDNFKVVERYLNADIPFDTEQIREEFTDREDSETLDKLLYRKNLFTSDLSIPLKPNFTLLVHAEPELSENKFSYGIQLHDSSDEDSEISLLIESGGIFEITVNRRQSDFECVGLLPVSALSDIQIKVVRPQLIFMINGINISQTTIEPNRFLQAEVGFMLDMHDRGSKAKVSFEKLVITSP